MFFQTLRKRAIIKNGLIYSTDDLLFFFYIPAFVTALLTELKNWQKNENKFRLFLVASDQRSQ